MCIYVSYMIHRVNFSVKVVNLYTYKMTYVQFLKTFIEIKITMINIYTYQFSRLHFTLDDKI